MLSLILRDFAQEYKTVIHVCVLIFYFFYCLLYLLIGSKWKPELVWCR